MITEFIFLNLLSKNTKKTFHKAKNFGKGLLGVR